MTEPNVFVNEESGEMMTLADYIARQREIERDLMRLDAAIETYKESLKAAKDGKEKAVRDLRATIREIKILGAESSRRGRRKKGASR